jgi:hypothetical protein
MINRIALPIPAGVVALAVSLPVLCLAQSTMSRVTITHLRPDMVSEWVDLQKNEVVPALKKSRNKIPNGVLLGTLRQLLRVRRNPIDR